MGRRATADELVPQAEANGYKRGVYNQCDQVRRREEHVKSTVGDQDATLRRYVLLNLAEMRRDAAECHLPLPGEEVARDRYLRPGIEAPDLVTVKDFLRFYIATSRPQLADVTTVDSINTVAEWFFTRFTHITQTKTNEEERREVYDVRKVSPWNMRMYLRNVI